MKREWLYFASDERRKNGGGEKYIINNKPVRIRYVLIRTIATGVYKPVSVALPGVYPPKRKRDGVMGLGRSGSLGLCSPRPLGGGPSQGKKGFITGSIFLIFIPKYTPGNFLLIDTKNFAKILF